MKKFFILICFLVIVINLAYSQQLKLPTEDIIGQLNTTADSLSISKDYSNYYNFSQIERLTYKPFLEKKMDSDDSTKQNGYLYVNGAYPIKTDIRLGLYSPKTPELNIYSRFFTEKIDDYTAKRFESDWIPLSNYTKWNLQPGMYFKTGNYENFYDPELSPENGEEIATDMTTLGLSISAKPNQQSFFSLYCNFLTTNYESKSSPYDRNLFEMMFNTKLFNLASILETDIKIYSYYENIHFASELFFNTPYLDLLAVHIQYSKSFWPSIHFEKAFKINKYTEFSVANRPFLKAESLFELYNKNPFADQRELTYAEQTPWNAFMTFTLLEPLEVQAIFNSQYIQNNQFIGFHHCYHYWNAEDTFINSITADAKMKFHDFKYGAKAKFMISKITTNKDIKHLPWEPHAVLSVSAGYKYRRFDTELTATQQMAKSNSGKEDDSDPKDVLILSNNNSLEVNKNIKLTLNIENILNQKYTEIEGFPKKGLTAELGLRILF